MSAAAARSCADKIAAAESSDAYEASAPPGLPRRRRRNAPQSNAFEFVRGEGPVVRVLMLLRRTRARPVLGRTKNRKPRSSRRTSPPSSRSPTTRRPRSANPWPPFQSPSPPLVLQRRLRPSPAGRRRRSGREFPARAARSATTRRPISSRTRPYDARVRVEERRARGVRREEPAGRFRTARVGAVRLLQRRPGLRALVVAAG